MPPGRYTLVLKGLMGDLRVGLRAVHGHHAGWAAEGHPGICGHQRVLFVKTLEGNRAYKAQQDFAIASQFGRRAIVRFTDGEEMRGYTLPGHAEAGHFLLFPVDPKSNNAKVYVIREATTFISAG